MQTHEKDIIDEIHERREAIMAKFGGSMENLFAYLKRRERRHPERVVDQITVVRSARPRRHARREARPSL